MQPTQIFKRHLIPIYVIKQLFDLCGVRIFPYEPSSTFTLCNPANNDAKMKEVPTFAMLQQFQVAEQVTCHNSGKSLWLDL